MRVRNREVNIFSMSLLDILCGAMAAFAFLMLALFPYYRPQSDPVPRRIDPKTLDDALKQLEDMRAKAIRFSEAYKRAEEERQRWSAQAQRWESEAQKEAAERSRLNREVQSLSSELATRNSLVFAINWEGANYDVDLWVLPRIRSAPTPPPVFDATKKPPMFNTALAEKDKAGGSASDCRISPCSEMRVFDRKSEGDYDIYFSLFGATRDQTGFVYLNGYVCCEEPVPGQTSKGVTLPPAVMNGTVASVQVGTLHIDDKRKFTMQYTPQFSNLASKYSAAKASDKQRADEEIRQREEQASKTQQELEDLRKAKEDAEAEVKRLQEAEQAKSKKTRKDGGQ